MSTDSPAKTAPHGLLWVLIPGAAGFCAGFFGPMVLVPESNLGPIVGVLFSGPAGVVLGLVGYFLTRAMPVPARGQWLGLVGLSALLALVTLFCVLPEPALQGYELEVKVTRLRAPAAATDEVIADWQKRIAHATWATPRAGWEQKMRDALRQDQGTVLEAAVVRQREIKVNRKPWNRGQLVALPWRAVNETRSYYIAPADHLAAVPGASLQLFVENDSTRNVQAPDIWPPEEAVQFISFTRATPVPAEYQTLP